MNIISLANASESLASNVGSQNPAWYNLVPFLMIFFVFYFLLIRPQMKKQKEHQNIINSLKKGDKIVTTGGIIANIVKLEDDILHIEIAPEVKIKITRNAISNIYDNTQNNNKIENNKISK